MSSSGWIILSGKSEGATSRRLLISIGDARYLLIPTPYYNRVCTLLQSEGQRAPGGLHLRLGTVQNLPAPLQRREGVVRELGGGGGFGWRVQPGKIRETQRNIFESEQLFGRIRPL